jgi:hypothetical protein
VPLRPAAPSARAAVEPRGTGKRPVPEPEGKGHLTRAPRPGSPGEPKYFNLAAVLAGGAVAFCTASVLNGLCNLIRRSAGGVGQDFCVSFAGATFAGFFAAAVANHYKIRHSLFAGLATAAFLIPGFLLLLLFAAIGLVTRWGELTVFLLGSCVWLAVTVPAAVLGGCLDQWLTWSVRWLNPQRQWTYVTSKGVRIKALAPWKHPVLACLWVVIGTGFIGTSWLHVFSTGVGMVFNSIVIGLVCLVLARKRSGKSVDELLGDDPRTPVIYLRSFADDGRKMREGIWYQFFQSLYALIARTVEQRLARAVRKYGPFIAIGRPGEDLPELGAARMYVSDNDWQEVVTDFLTRPGATVLFQVGETPGLRWELQAVSRHVPPARVLLIVPFPLMSFLVPFSLPTMRRRRAQRYAAFCQWGQGVWPGRLPDQIGDAFFIYFEAKPAWTARALDRRQAVPYHHPLSAALKVLRKDKTFGWWIFSVYTKVFLYAFIPIIALLILGALIALFAR